MAAHTCNPSAGEAEVGGGALGIKMARGPAQADTLSKKQCGWVLNRDSCNMDHACFIYIVFHWFHHFIDSHQYAS